MSVLISLMMINTLFGGPIENPPITQIAFGSCNRTDKPQPMWAPILASRPQVWIWTGDIVYGDTENMNIMRAKYDVQKRNPDYQRLLSQCRVIGIWDDHDYGLNNGGREFRQKAGSQQALLDFLDTPPDSPRRLQKGAYASHTFGPAGKQIKVILLDARYHRGSKGRGKILGRAQWRWLENELRDSRASLHLIVSGIQVIPMDHKYEKWANFPAARERLIQIIAKLKTPGVIFLSGDRHFAEISMAPDTAAGYPIYDVTSSGLTHSYLEYEGEPNRYRVGDMFTDLNFGMIEIDWDAKPVSVDLQIRDKANKIRRQKKLALSDLQPDH